MIKQLLFFVLPLSLYALERVEISADNFEADEFKKVSYFKGSVHIKKGLDEIKSDKLRIDFNQKNRPIKYEATGKVSFHITTEGQHFQGTSNIVIYQPIDKKYIASGAVHIIETTKNRTLEGEMITIDRVSGKSKISGSDKQPVKFIFTVEE